MNKNLTERREAGGWRLEAERRTQGAAFTLIELLIVITIIGILASMSIVVTQQVYYSARQSKTQVTIAKIDQLVLEIYEKFESRRISTSGLGNNPQVSQAARLWVLRDLMRMEMPGNWDEVMNGPARLQFRKKNGNDYVVVAEVMGEDSPLRKIFAKKYLETIKTLRKSYPDWKDADLKLLLNRNASAKCLYLIVTYTMPEAREKFYDNEIATDPDDGLSYFVDGWGNPIYFLRWAPGLVDSDRQPVVRDSTSTQAFWKTGDQTNSNPGSWFNALFNSAKNSAAEQMPDPWDPTEVGGIINIGSSQPAQNTWAIDLDEAWLPPPPPGVPYKNDKVRGWMLIPLVISTAGVHNSTETKTSDNRIVQDGNFGKNFGITFVPPGYANAPVIDPFYWPLGELCIDKNDPNFKDFNFSAIHNQTVRR